MTVKVQCGCGTRYSFDVEPTGGVMPFRVNCPSCNADGTLAANQFIAQAAAAEPKPLRVQGVAAHAAPAPIATAEDAPMPPPPRRGVSTSLKKIEAERRQMRLVGWMAAAIALVLAALAGAWGWYTFVGSKPRLEYSMKLDLSQPFWRTEFLDGGRLLIASSTRVILHDAHTHSDLWSAQIPGHAGSPPPQVFVDKEDIWLRTGDQVVRLDEKTGQLKATIPVAGQFESFTPTESSILVVSATTETERALLEIDRSSGEASRRTINVPRAEKHAMPDELPPNVQPTAGVLLSQALDEQKFNKPLDAVSSEFFSAGQNLVELRVTLLKPNVTWVKSIKPRGQTLINGNLTAGTAGVEEEVLNDIKRDQSGGVKSIDESLYEVRLRRWAGDQPVEWKGNLTGVPEFFPLQTVDLVAAGKSLTVFDKKNGKLFEAQLSYQIDPRFMEDNTERLAPAVEQSNVLYFFDQAVLTAFSLPAGEVKCRLTSVGISHAQFDDAGFLYLDTTSKSPEDIQYSDQIKLEGAASVIMKVDPRLGKILWQTQNQGQRCVLSGKYVYGVSRERGGIALANGLAEGLNAPRPEAPVFFHIFRLDPESGKLMWKFYREEAPDEDAFQNNSFALRFGNDLQVWKFLSF